MANCIPDMGLEESLDDMRESFKITGEMGSAG